MASETLKDRQDPGPLQYLSVSGHIPALVYSVGVMAYNEEANIKRTLLALLEQLGEKTCLHEVIVVASGCTDNTVPIVEALMLIEPRVQLIVQERREGKASAINLFLQRAVCPILVLVGADTIPEHDTLEQLCAHFADATVGMVGGHPIPVNDQNTFVGYAVHLLWRLHDRMARSNPKLGEIVAFRNSISALPTDSAVDEVSIEALIAKQGLQLVYEPDAIVYNKGPMTVGDFLKQRRRIYAGHLNVRAQNHYLAATMNIGPIARALGASIPYVISSPKQLAWTMGTVALEGFARLQGRYDTMRKRSHQVWQAVTSTKTLEDEQRKLRRICYTQSVIVFHISRVAANKHIGLNDSAIRRIIRKLLPHLRQYLRQDDILNIHGSNTLIAVLTADQQGAELIASRLKHIIATQHIPRNKGGDTRLLVSYHAVSFGQ